LSRRRYQLGVLAPAENLGYVIVVKVRPPLPPPITLWFNPDCSKSRRAKELLESAKAELTLFEYLKTPPTEEQLRHLVSILRVPLRKIVRSGERIYAELQLSQADDATLLQAMCQHPSLIQRPIAVAPDRGQAVVARPPEMLFRLMLPVLPEGTTADELLRLAMQGKLAAQLEPVDG
jgi:arsenate reductase